MARKTPLVVLKNQQTIKEFDLNFYQINGQPWPAKFQFVDIRYSMLYQMHEDDPSQWDEDLLDLFPEGALALRGVKTSRAKPPKGLLLLPTRLAREIGRMVRSHAQETMNLLKAR
jgi:hypothetical protein